MKDTKIISYDEWEKNYLIAVSLRTEILNEIDFMEYWIEHYGKTLESIEHNIEVEMKLMLEHVHKSEELSAATDTEPILNNEYWQLCMRKYAEHKTHIHQIMIENYERSTEIIEEEIPTGQGQERH